MCAYDLKSERFISFYQKLQLCIYMDISVENSVGGIYQNVSEGNGNKDAIFGLFLQFGIPE